ncbi:hypothetical protein N658DRAFT_62731 [Parathielavia hyrcaniae]|uniref:Secreted protein n=1 Tax=Parathielavia hyrcaniae TaxID=113614 RepID=A0AAN6T2C5_9PEZI|nr:hypothetical protein N658DRAFT_62731 [Parathielavia hyrcaniae]
MRRFGRPSTGQLSCSLPAVATLLILPLHRAFPGCSERIPRGNLGGKVNAMGEKWGGRWPHCHSTRGSQAQRGTWRGTLSGLRRRHVVIERPQKKIGLLLRSKLKKNYLGIEERCRKSA